jgi:hypothetical protein
MKKLLFLNKGKIFLLLLCLTKIVSCSYVFTDTMEKLKLLSSKVKNVCAFVDFEGKDLRCDKCKKKRRHFPFD